MFNIKNILTKNKSTSTPTDINSAIDDVVILDEHIVEPTSQDSPKASTPIKANLQSVQETKGPKEQLVTTIKPAIKPEPKVKPSNETVLTHHVKEIKPIKQSPPPIPQQTPPIVAQRVSAISKTVQEPVQKLSKEISQDTVQKTKKEPIQPKKPTLKIPKRNKLAVKSAMLHTYKQDVEGLVKRRRVSLVKAVAAQSDQGVDVKGGRVTNTLANTKKQVNTNIFMIIASILLIVLGGIALFAAYSANQTTGQAHKKQAQAIDNSLIFVEHRAHLNITDRLPRETRTALANLLRSSNATLGSITEVLLEWSTWDEAISAKRTSKITQSQVLQALGLNLSDSFVRLIGRADAYMVGMHMADRNTPFILLTTNSYEHAFAAMLEWEDGGEGQLMPLFATGGSGSGVRTVEDIVVQNIDARVVRDDARAIKLLYSFIDQNTLLITNNIHTLTEVAQRYKVRRASGSAQYQKDLILR